MTSRRPWRARTVVAAFVLSAVALRVTALAASGTPRGRALLDAATGGLLLWVVLVTVTRFFGGRRAIQVALALWALQAVVLDQVVSPFEWTLRFGTRPVTRGSGARLADFQGWADAPGGLAVPPGGTGVVVVKAQNPRFRSLHVGARVEGSDPRALDVAIQVSWDGKRFRRLPAAVGSPDSPVRLDKPLFKPDLRGRGPTLRIRVHNPTSETITVLADLRLRTGGFDWWVLGTLGSLIAVLGWLSARIPLVARVAAATGAVLGRPATPRDEGAAPAPGRPARRRVGLVLLGLAAALALARLHTYDEPLERDITGYAVVAHELLAGRRLYSDIWDHKPPAVHLTFALAELLVGYGPQTVYLVNVAAGLATLLGVYTAGSAVAGSQAGLWTAAFWVAISGNLWLQANQPNVEVLVSASLAWAFALLVRAPPSGFRARHALGVGLLFALASLYKPVALPSAAGLACAHVACPPAGTRTRWAALGHVALMAAVGMAAWLAVGAYFAAAGRFGDFWDAVVVYNRGYAGDLARNLRAGLTALPPADAVDSLGPLVIVAGLGVLAARRAPPVRPWALLLAFALGTGMAVALPRRFFPHYFQLWLPPLVIAAGWAVGAFRAVLAPHGRLAHLTAVAALALVAAREAPAYLRSAEEWSRDKYGLIFINSQRAGREVDALLAPGQTFFEWGSETGVYFASRRSPPTGVFYATPVVGGPLADTLRRRLLADLERTRPELLLVPRSALARQHHPVLAWCLERYRPVPQEPRNGFVFFVRVGGALDRGSGAARGPGTAR